MLFNLKHISFIDQLNRNIYLPDISHIIEFLSSIPEQLLKWLSTNEARNDFYSWIIFTVIIGGSFSLLFFTIKSIWKAINYKIFQSKKYADYLGEYYLYHPPLIIGLNNLPRVSKIILTSNWLTPGKAQQLNVKDHRLVYKGTFEIHRSVLFFHLSIPRDECPKAITLWHFQIRSRLKDRIAFGTMCCINFKEEPYRAPIIVSENRLPQSKVISAFKIMTTKTTITRDVRRKLMSHFNDCDIGDPNEIFEHIISGTGPIGSSNSTGNLFSKNINSFKSKFLLFTRKNK